MSPEIIKGEHYSKEVDVWSFGCFAYELATGQPLFGNKRRHALNKAIMDSNVPEINKKKWSAQFQDFINKCLIRNKDERMTIDQALAHPFLAEMDREQCKAAWIQDMDSFM